MPSPTLDQQPHLHPPITGGCLCGRTRYTISFPAGSAWPPDPYTCQCTQCRKNTGALVAPWLNVLASQIVWTPPHSAPDSSFKRYRSSRAAWRGFCGECGSALLYVGEDEGEVVGVLAGSVDEGWLVGVEVVEGEGIRREGGVGRELCVPTGGNLWCRNQIVGVTDRVLAGRKLVEGDGSEVMD